MAVAATVHAWLARSGASTPQVILIATGRKPGVGDTATIVSEDVRLSLAMLTARAASPCLPLGPPRHAYRSGRLAMLTARAASPCLPLGPPRHAYRSALATHAAGRCHTGVHDRTTAWNRDRLRGP